MFLMVYVTLVVGLIGVFSQVYTLQAARMYANQNAIAKAMLAWHTTAEAFVTKSVSLTSYSGAQGCDLTTTITPGVVNACRNQAGQDIFVNLQTAPTGFANCTAAATNCWVSRDSYSGSGTYTFFSIAYRSGTPAQSYVLTYVPPPTAADALGNRLVSLPGSGATAARSIGITIDSLFRQLSKTNLDIMAYGTIVTQSGVQYLRSGVGTANGTNTAVLWPLPARTFQDGTVGILTAMLPCPNC